MKIGKYEIKIEKPDKRVYGETQKRLDNLTKPLGSLGRLEELAKQTVAITGRRNPMFDKKIIFTLAGDHGVTEEGVSAYPKEVTPQMVYNILNGGAGINVLARHVKAEVRVVDLGVAVDLVNHPALIIRKINYGTKNFTKGPAMTRMEAVRSVEAGIELILNEKNINIAGTGDMGIGNTTPSSAITAVFTGEKVEAVTGRGTGIDDNTFNKKIKTIKKGISINKPDKNDALDVLSKIGGFEIGGIAGVIIGAALRKIPVVIDGFISTAAALIAVNIEPDIKEYLMSSHRSVEKGHKAALKYLGLRPILDLDLRLGEGTGAALAINIIEASVKILNEMATFDSAGVSKKENK